MKRTAQDILNFVEDNDVKFAKLTFCDIFGNQKNVSLFASELPRAFAEGVSFDGSSIAGFMNVEESDLVLWPDPDTATVLPWRPTEGRVIRMYCDITLPNGKPFEGNCRGYLQSVVKRARAMGLVCNVGCECEFYLFETDEHGSPTRIPLDIGGYFDIPPLDKGENIRREICFAIEEMGLHPEHSHHESGHGQNEVCFRYTTALKSADNLNTFKSTVKAIAARNGLFASFMPKPLANQPGSGLHVNVSLLRDGKNLFDGAFTPDSEAGHFVAGILAHEITHVTAKHHLLAIRKTAQSGMLTQLLASQIKTNAVGNMVASQFLALGRNLYARGLDQTDEYDADRTGVALATRAGFDPYGLVSVLQQLRTATPDNPPTQPVWEKSRDRPQRAGYSS